MAGHSKWKNIQHRKGAQDAKRGKIFTKIAVEIMVAARQGGGGLSRGRGEAAQRPDVAQRAGACADQGGRARASVFGVEKRARAGPHGHGRDRAQLAEPELGDDELEAGDDGAAVRGVCLARGGGARRAVEHEGDREEELREADGERVEAVGVEDRCLFFTIGRTGFGARIDQ